MDNTNSKVLTFSFALTGAILGFTFHLLLKSLAGAFGVIARISDSDLVRHGAPVLVGVGVFCALQFNPKIRSWADEVVIEMRKVVFPSRKDTTAMTMLVVIMVVISSTIVTMFDLASGSLLRLLMN